MFKAVLDVVVHQRLLRSRSLFLRLAVAARFRGAATPFLQHAENTLDVALGPFEPFENIGGKGGVCRHDHIRRLR